MNTITVATTTRGARGPRGPSAVWGDVVGTITGQADLMAQFATRDSGLAGKQPLDAELSAIAGLASAADKVAYFTGSGTAALAGFTTFGRSLVAAADADAFWTALGSRRSI